MSSAKALGNLLVLTYWDFRDALVQTYTLPYLRIIQQHQSQDARIYFLTLEKDPQFASSVEGARYRENLGASRIVWLPKSYKSYGIGSMIRWISWLAQLRGIVIRNRIDTIHAFATPAGAAGYLLSILTGASLVLDSYEPHAEAMVENGTWNRRGVAFRLLFKLEKLQTRRAKAVIGTTSGMLEYAKRNYGDTIRNFYVKPACVDLTLFSHPPSQIKSKVLEEWKWTGKIICVYAGKLGGIYLDREVFDFLKAASDYWGDRFRFLFLTNQTREEVMTWCERSGFEFENLKMLFVPHKEVPKYLSLADFAITPVKPVPTKRYCTPIKDGEYWAMGLPVVIPDNISDDSNIVRRESIGAVLNSLDQASYKSALTTIDSLLSEPKNELMDRMRSVAVRYRDFAIAEEVYGKVYGNGRHGERNG